MHSASQPVVLPSPRSLSVSGPGFTIDEGTHIAPPVGPAPESVRLAERIRDVLKEDLGIPCPVTPGTAGGGIRFATDAGLPAEGYRLRVAATGADLVGRDLRGLRHGVATLAQLVRQFGARLPGCIIEDHPAFPVRGVMLDISRDKVPTMETLYAVVDLLAALKINHLELYTEHTFAYRSHFEVWRDASPMTAAEVRALDAYCAERGIDLVPNQNSFGHFARWLKHASYRDLAECTGPFTYPWGATGRGPLSLDPAHPGSLDLLEELYADLLPNFRSRTFNVGCDEVFDLGQGRSRERCERDGRGRVYLAFVQKIHALVRRHGRDMTMWGDMLLKDPEVLRDLPDDITVLDWGYEADHPFDEECTRLAEAGRSFYVCPGTSSWLTLLGRTTNCLANLEAAARAGRTHGAGGYLVTDWGDGGHWQPLPISFLGLAAGAAAAWSGRVPAADDLIAALDLHVFRDAAGVMGRTVHDAGNVYLSFARSLHNQSMLYHLLVASPETVMQSGVTIEEVDRAREQLRGVLRDLDRADMDRPDAALVSGEVAFAARLGMHAADRAQVILDGSWTQDGVRIRLDGNLAERVDEFKHVWLKRNRDGGLRDSVSRFASARIGAAPPVQANR